MENQSISLMAELRQLREEIYLLRREMKQQMDAVKDAVVSSTNTSSNDAAAETKTIYKYHYPHTDVTNPHHYPSDIQQTAYPTSPYPSPYPYPY
jgi:hypothetical protein